MREVDGTGNTLLADSQPDVSAHPRLLAGRYEIVGLLGVGGMGCVYRARDRELDELVALKVLRRELMAMPGIVERFRQEVRLARKVTSPHVARTFDIGEDEAGRFLTMELVDGESLADLLARDGRLSQARALTIASAVISGLAAAHAVGVVHRDLKPENVLLGKTGNVKITDFGIAKASESASLTQGAIGTPAYMAPEQVTADVEADERADIYAFGAILYEMLTGEPPWTGSSVYAIASARLYREAPDPQAKRPDVSATLAELTRHAMARRREDRPKSAHEIAAVLASMTPPPDAPIARFAEPRLEAPRSKGVAVLPLRNGGDAGDDHIADGLTEDVIDALAMAHGLKVHSRASVMRYRGVTRDPRDIGRELGVDVFVDGTVRRAGDRLRVSVRLVGVADGLQVWTRRFDHPLGELLAIGDVVATAVASALSVARVETPPRAAVDPAALDLYLRGRREYHEFRVESVRRALAFFEAGLAIAPDEPRILAARAMALLRILSLGDSSSELFEEASRCAARVIELDPRAVDGHAAMAAACNHALRYVEAARHAKAAVEMAPSCGDARIVLGVVLYEIGRLRESLVQFERACDLDPTSDFGRLGHVRATALNGDWDRAREIALASSSHAPHYWMIMLRVFGLWQDDVSAVAAIRSRVKDLGLLDDPRIDGALRAAGGDVEQYLAHIRRRFGGGRAGAQTPRTVVFGEQLAFEALTRAGRGEEAFGHLVAAVDGGLLDVAWLDRCPILEAARREPAFASLRDRVADRAREVDAVVF